MQEQVFVSIPINQFKLLIADVVIDCLSHHIPADFKSEKAPISKIKSTAFKLKKEVTGV